MPTVFESSDLGLFRDPQKIPKKVLGIFRWCRTIKDLVFGTLVLQPKRVLLSGCCSSIL